MQENLFSVKRKCLSTELRGQDLNLRPSGYEPDELPDCSTPRYHIIYYIHISYKYAIILEIFYFLMDGGGFEPPKALLTDLQSAPFGHSGTHPYVRFFNLTLLLISHFFSECNHFLLFILKNNRRVFPHFYRNLPVSHNIFISFCRISFLISIKKTRHRTFLWNI